MILQEGYRKCILLGEYPYCFLKIRLKWAISLNPQRKATSVIVYVSFLCCWRQALRE